MELKDFIKQALLDIDKWLKEASEDLWEEKKKYDYKFWKNISWNSTIDFEVQVFASKKNNSDIKWKVGIPTFWLWVSAKWWTESDSHELSKISFSVVRENTLEEDYKESEARRKINNKKIARFPMDKMR